LYVVTAITANINARKIVESKLIGTRLETGLSSKLSLPL